MAQTQIQAPISQSCFLSRLCGGLCTAAAAFLRRLAMSPTPIEQSATVSPSLCASPLVDAIKTTCTSHGQARCDTPTKGDRDKQCDVQADVTVMETKVVGQAFAELDAVQPQQSSSSAHAIHQNATVPHSLSPLPSSNRSRDMPMDLDTTVPSRSLPVAPPSSPCKSHDNTTSSPSPLRLDLSTGAKVTETSATGRQTRPRKHQVEEIPRTFCSAVLNDELCNQSSTIGATMNLQETKARADQEVEVVRGQEKSKVNAGPHTKVSIKNGGPQQHWIDGVGGNRAAYKYKAESDVTTLNTYDGDDEVNGGAGRYVDVDTSKVKEVDTCKVKEAGVDIGVDTDDDMISHEDADGGYDPDFGQDSDFRTGASGEAVTCFDTNKRNDTNIPIPNDCAPSYPAIDTGFGGIPGNETAPGLVDWHTWNAFSENSGAGNSMATEGMIDVTEAAARAAIERAMFCNGGMDVNARAMLMTRTTTTTTTTTTTAAREGFSEVYGNVYGPPLVPPIALALAMRAAAAAAAAPYRNDTDVVPPQQLPVSMPMPRPLPLVPTPLEEMSIMGSWGPNGVLSTRGNECEWFAQQPWVDGSLHLQGNALAPTATLRPPPLPSQMWTPSPRHDAAADQLGTLHRIWSAHADTGSCPPVSSLELDADHHYNSTLRRA